ncbi:glycosyltransferase family 2 protein [Rheinheimera sp.]|uniref:glycosyltransferase family 2 protein n=1 Tax=Rheinheimera sp. TaxID=1869214 RepID=UPI003D26B33E
MLENISLIVIARNESFGIEKVFKALRESSFANAQFILVDSGSTDNTASQMKSFSTLVADCKLIQLSGKQNASIARNAGLALAEREFCFFIDGDTEVSRSFIDAALEQFRTQPDVVAIAGDLTDYLYNQDFSELKEISDNRFSITKITENRAFGGNVIMKTDIAKQVRWDEQLPVHEDFDISLRLRQLGKVLLLPVSMGVHHTRYDTRNAYSLLFSRNPKYFGILIRKNFKNHSKLLLSINRGHWIGLFYYVFFIFLMFSYLSEIGFLYIVFAFCALSLFDFSKAGMKNIPQSVADWFVVRFIYPFFVIYGFCRIKKSP